MGIMTHDGLKSQRLMGFNFCITIEGEKIHLSWSLLLKHKDGKIWGDERYNDIWFEGWH